MNRRLSVLLVISLFLFASCEQDQTIVNDNPDGVVNPLTCLSAGPSSVNKCDMVWKMVFTKEAFPQNVGVYLNDKVIFDECKRDPRIAIERRLDTVEIILYSYNRLDGKEKFKLALYDLGNCYEPKKDYYYNANQSYTIKEIGTQKYVLINGN